MTEDTQVQKRQYLIANAYLEMAVCLIDDIDSYIDDDSSNKIHFEKDKIFQNYKSAFYYFSKAKGMDLNRSSNQFEAYKLSCNFTDYYLNRKSLETTLNFSSLDSDMQNTMTVYSLEEQLRYLRKISTLLNESDPVRLEAQIAASYFRSMKSNMRLVVDEFSKKDCEDFLDFKHSVFEDLKKSIDLSSNAIQSNAYQDFVINQIDCFDEEALKIVFESKEEAAEHYINMWSMVFHGWKDIAKSAYGMLRCIALEIEDHDNSQINEFSMEHAFLLRSVYERSKFVLFACNETLIEDKLFSGVYSEPITMLVH